MEEKNNKEIYFPGDFLGNEMEYIGGEGTIYDENGDILSIVTGEKQINGRNISIISKNQIRSFKKGDEVIGQIISLNDNRAIILITPYNKESRPISQDVVGSLHVRNTKKGFLKSLRDAFSLGDIIFAKIDSIENESINLSTVDFNCGVLITFCKTCRNKLKLQKGNFFKCNKCKKTETRVVSNLYGKIKV